MASLINQAKSTLTGRNTIALTDGQTTVRLDVVTKFTYTSPGRDYKKKVAETKKDKSPVVDNISNELGNIAIEAILSDNLNVVRSTLGFTDGRVSMKDKLKQINIWKDRGTVLKLLGYTTGVSGAISKVASFLNRGNSSLFNSKLKDENFLGTDTDIIENLVISGNSVFSRTSDLGSDGTLTLTLQRIAVVKKETLAGATTPEKGSTPAATNQKPGPKKIDSAAMRGLNDSLSRN